MFVMVANHVICSNIVLARDIIMLDVVCAQSSDVNENNFVGSIILIELLWRNYFC